MKKHLLPFISVLLPIVFVSCERSDSSTDPKSFVPQYQVTTGEYTFYADQEKYQDAYTRRGDADYCQVPSSILNVARQGNGLTIDISRPKAYTVTYEIIWDGRIMESYPMMTNIFIRTVPKDHRDLEGTVTDILVIDLEKTFKDLTVSTLKDLNFMVREACSLNNIKCLENCDVPVSN